jgi:hypothetical protein
MERATSPLAWWDPRQYVVDALSGNVRLGQLVKYLALSWYRAVMRRHPRARGVQFPSIVGLAEGQTPTATLNLQPGELVEVRSKTEIMTTINAKQKNRGLWFDVEMLPFCNRRFRVLRRVERIVDEKTGKMLRLPGVCLILDGVTCGGNLSRDRMFCPRAIYPYWREIWLKRAESDKTG